MTGRLVDDDGKPATGFSLGNGPAPETFDPDRGWLPVNRRIEIDRDGRFRIDRLVPGLSYTIYANQPIQLFGPICEGLRAKPGEVKDLGDVKVIPYRD